MGSGGRSPAQAPESIETSVLTYPELQQSWLRVNGEVVSSDQPTANAESNIFGDITQRASSLSFAMAYTDLTDTVTIGAGAKIAANQGNVDIAASGTEYNYPTAMSYIWGAALAGQPHHPEHHGDGGRC